MDPLEERTNEEQLCPRGSVHVTRELSLKSEKELRKAFKCSHERHTPESSAWKDEILREAGSDDPDQRLRAYCCFANISREIMANDQGYTKASECATYLLQRGFLKGVQKGFQEAVASGKWILVPQGDTNFRARFFINRVSGLCIRSGRTHSRQDYHFIRAEGIP